MSNQSDQRTGEKIKLTESIDGCILILTVIGNRISMNNSFDSIESTY